jgi:hypothetical protein
MYLPGIYNNELCTLLYGPGDLSANNGVISCSVRAYGEDASRIEDFIYRISHGPATETGGQTGHRWRVSETGTMINIIGF